MKNFDIEAVKCRPSHVTSIPDCIRRSTAIHESAHAVIAHQCGWTIGHIRVFGDWDDHPDWNGRTRLLVHRGHRHAEVDRMYYVVAGHVAELIDEFVDDKSGRFPDGIWDLHCLMDDGDSEPETTVRCSDEWQEFRDLLWRRTTDTLGEEPSERNFGDIWYETLDSVVHVLVHQWPSIELLTAAVLEDEHGELTGAEISELLGRCEEQPFEIPACIPASLLATAKAPLLRQLLSRPGVGRTPRRKAA